MSFYYYEKETAKWLSGPVVGFELKTFSDYRIHANIFWIGLELFENGYRYLFLNEKLLHESFEMKFYKTYHK